MFRYTSRFKSSCFIKSDLKYPNVNIVLIINPIAIYQTHTKNQIILPGKEHHNRFLVQSQNDTQNGILSSRHITDMKPYGGTEMQNIVFLPKLNLKWRNKFICIDRDSLRQIISVITGHCCLDKHLFNMKISASPICYRCGLEEETVARFFCICPTDNSLRNNILKNHQINKICQPLEKILNSTKQIKITDTRVTYNGPIS